MPRQLKWNLHTHTSRCRHASGSIIDYCREASLQGLRVLGISDHTPLPDNRWIQVRMDMDELDPYCQEIDDARVAYPQLKILKGMECEFDAPYEAFYREELLGARGFDYLIGASHWYPHMGDWKGVYGALTIGARLRSYADYYIESMRSGLFTFMAHPDVFGNCYPRWDADCVACARDILQAAASLKIPLEINAYGLRKPIFDSPEGKRPGYPWLPFWELAADYEITVVLSSDAHTPATVATGLQECLDIAKKFNLTLAEFPSLISSE